jgi:hypothetical protein
MGLSSFTLKLAQCAHFVAPNRVRGGLGLGFTLAATLARPGPVVTCATPSLGVNFNNAHDCTNVEDFEINRAVHRRHNCATFLNF